MGCVLSLVALIVIVAFVTLLAAGRTFYWVGDRSYRSVELLAGDLARLTGLTPSVANRLGAGGVDRVSLQGRLPSGRGAWIHFFSKSEGAHTTPYVRFAVAADPALRVSVYREGLLTPLGKWLGTTRDVDSGDRWFDERFVVATPGEERARRAYAQGFKEAVMLAFDRYGTVGLDISDGHLMITAPRAHNAPGAFPEILATLDQAAHAFDRVPIVVRALGDATRRAYASGGKPRCAYCHGDVTGEEPDLVACERCATVLHAGCWEELGRCPLLGCDAKTPERARA